MKCNNALEELDKTIQHLLHYIFFYLMLSENHPQNGYFGQKIVNINGDAVKIL